MKDALEKLKEFHRVFDCARQDSPAVVDKATQMLRWALIAEEGQETLRAMQAEDLEQIADGLADLCYVVIGTAVAYGIPLDKVFEEVHRANMTKAEKCVDCPESENIRCLKCNGVGYLVRRREDGKILKPEGWQPPDIKKVLGL